MKKYRIVKIKDKFYAQRDVFFGIIWEYLHEDRAGDPVGFAYMKDAEGAISNYHNSIPQKDKVVIKEFYL